MTNTSNGMFRPKQKYDKVISIKCTQKEYDELKSASKILLMPRSDVIRLAINEFLLNHL